MIINITWKRNLKKSFFNKERYEKNKDEILKNVGEKYRTQHDKDLEKENRKGVGGVGYPPKYFYRK